MNYKKLLFNSISIFYLVSISTVPSFALFSSRTGNTANIFIASAHFGSPTPSLTPSLTVSPIPSLSLTPSISVSPSISPTPTLLSFGTCPVINGSVQASYATGMHAIVGMDKNQSGSDTVFGIGSDNYTQCYCPTIGTAGIQTNWLAAGKLSSFDKTSFTSTGWTLIAKGTDWGLSSQAYLAKNQSFICSVPGTLTPIPTQTSR